MRKTLLIAIVALLTFSCEVDKQEPQVADKKQIEKELVEAIEDRFYSWRDNDYDAHMETYHQDWKRWALRENKLLTKVLVKENDKWLCIGGHRDFSQPAGERTKFN